MPTLSEYATELAHRRARLQEAYEGRADLPLGDLVSDLRAGEAMLSRALLEHLDRLCELAGGIDLGPPEEPFFGRVRTRAGEAARDREADLEEREERPGPRP